MTPKKMRARAEASRSKGSSGPSSASAGSRPARELGRGGLEACPQTRRPGYDSAANREAQSRGGRPNLSLCIETCSSGCLGRARITDAQREQHLDDARAAGALCACLTAQTLVVNQLLCRLRASITAAILELTIH